VTLSAIPRTPNGKVDRRALPEPVVQNRVNTRGPRTQREIILTNIFSEVLRLDNVSVEDNVFELGADSIQVFQIVSRANRAGLDINVQQVLRYPTIEALSSASGTEGEKATEARLKPIRPVARDRFRVKNA